MPRRLQIRLPRRRLWPALYMYSDFGNNEHSVCCAHSASFKLFGHARIKNGHRLLQFEGSAPPSPGAPTSLSKTVCACCPCRAHHCHQLTLALCSSLPRAPARRASRGCHSAPAPCGRRPCAPGRRLRVPVAHGAAGSMRVVEPSGGRVLTGSTGLKRLGRIGTDCLRLMRARLRAARGCGMWE